MFKRWDHGDPRGSIMVTIMVATHGEVHGATSTTQAVSSKLVVPSKAQDTKAMTQAMSL